jgi:WD40 repeat protein
LSAIFSSNNLKFFLTTCNILYFVRLRVYFKIELFFSFGFGLINWLKNQIRKHFIVFNTYSQVNKVIQVSSQEIITANNDHYVKRWTIATESLAPGANTYAHPQQVTSAVLLPNGQLATGSCDNFIRIWNLTNTTEVKSWSAHAGCVKDLKVNMAIGSNGALVSVSDSDENCVKVWDLNGYSLNASSEKAAGGIKCLIVLPSGDMLTGSTKVEMWSWKPGSVVRKGVALSLNSTASSDIVSMGVFPDGVHVACGMTEYLNVLNTNTQRITLVLKVDSGAINAIQMFALSGSSQVYMVTASAGGQLNCWTGSESSLTKNKEKNFGSDNHPTSLYYNFNETSTTMQLTSSSTVSTTATSGLRIITLTYAITTTTTSTEITTVSKSITTPPANSGQTCGFFAGLDFFGNDITSFANVGSTDQCCDLCNSYSECGSNQRCNAWTFRRPESKCYLKYGTS